MLSGLYWPGGMFWSSAHSWSAFATQLKFIAAKVMGNNTTNVNLNCCFALET